MSDKPHFLKTFDSRHRLLISIAFGSFITALLPATFHLVTRFLCVWNSSTYCFLGLTWLTMVQSTPQKMRYKAQRQYEGRLAVFALIIAAACASILAIVFILNNKTDSHTSISNIHVLLSFLTIVASWFLVHTIFTMQYAYTFYQDKYPYSEHHAGGLVFPEEDCPDYWDFLYFSFVIGMTSQVSDVQAVTRVMRRIILVHSILSFFFNTTILALSINIIASLI